jgi:hypothetical protein
MEAEDSALQRARAIMGMETGAPFVLPQLTLPG